MSAEVEKRPAPHPQLALQSLHSIADVVHQGLCIAILRCRLHGRIQTVRLLNLKYVVCLPDAFAHLHCYTFDLGAKIGIYFQSGKDRLLRTQPALRAFERQQISFIAGQQKTVLANFGIVGYAAQCVNGALHCLQIEDPRVIMFGTDIDDKKNEAECEWH